MKFSWRRRYFFVGGGFFPLSHANPSRMLEPPGNTLGRGFVCGAVLARSLFSVLALVLVAGLAPSASAVAIAWSSRRRGKRGRHHGLRRSALRLQHRDLRGHERAVRRVPGRRPRPIRSGSTTSNGRRRRYHAHGARAASSTPRRRPRGKARDCVSFYDALRFANWLTTARAAGGTESGAYLLLGGTATPSNASSPTRITRHRLHYQRKRVVQGRLLQPDVAPSTSTTRPARTPRRLRSAPTATANRELQQRHGAYERGQLHGLGEPERHLRPGRQRLASGTRRSSWPTSAASAAAPSTTSTSGSPRARAQQHHPRAWSSTT